jgi:hypothetical protein
MALKPFLASPYRLRRRKRANFSIEKFGLKNVKPYMILRIPALFTGKPYYSGLVVCFCSQCEAVPGYEY